MRGSIQQLKDKTGKLVNRFRIQIYTGVTLDGKYIRHVETVTGRKGDVVKRLHELSVGLEKGIPIPSGRLTVAEHLKNWLESYAATKASRTLESYTCIAERHLIPSLGNYQLKQLTPEVIRKYYADACQKLSPRSVHKHHRLLSQALKQAVRNGYLGINPCQLVDAPKWQPKPMRTLTESEVELFLEAASDSYFYPIYYTAISSGLRQSEILGLRWRDIDFKVCSLSVSQTLFKRRGVLKFTEPKTQHSRRRITLTEKLATFLKDYYGQCELLSFRFRGKGLSLDDLVFTNVKFEPVDASALSHEFLAIAKRVGLKDAHFHTLRHSFGSLMLMKGAPAKVISECLGHSSVAFTLATYAHVLPGMQERAIQLLNDVLPGGVSKKLTPI